MHIKLDVFIGMVVACPGMHKSAQFVNWQIYSQKGVK